MAKRKGPRNYKQVRTMTKSMGSSGGQEHCLAVKKLDPQLVGSYLNNIVASIQLNSPTTIDPDASRTTPAFTLYLTTSNVWNDDNVITARTVGGSGGTVSLSAKRYIKSDDEDVDGTTGPVHLWAEMTDIQGLLEETEARITMEVWGRYISLTLDTS